MHSYAARLLCLFIYFSPKMIIIVSNSYTVVFLGFFYITKICHFYRGVLNLWIHFTAQFSKCRKACVHSFFLFFFIFLKISQDLPVRSRLCQTPPAMSLTGDFGSDTSSGNRMFLFMLPQACPQPHWNNRRWPGKSSMSKYKNVQSVLGQQNMINRLFTKFNAHTVMLHYMGMTSNMAQPKWKGLDLWYNA